MNSANLKNTVLVLTAATLLSACAPRGSDAGSTESSSRSTDTTTSSTKLASCNQASSGDMTAKLRAFVDASTNTYNSNYMVVRLSKLPSTFKSSGSYISMQKWLGNSSGGTSLDSNFLSFYILNPKTKLAVTSWKTSLRWADVSTAAASLGYTDADSFFSAMKIVVDLKDANAEYDVLRISNYDASTNKSLNQIDALMPLFYANPATYATESNGQGRAAVLQSLHPFKAYASAGYTDSQFVSMSESYCF